MHRNVADPNGYRPRALDTGRDGGVGLVAWRPRAFARCDEKVHVTQGDTIPKCPNGHEEYETRRNEPGNKG